MDEGLNLKLRNGALTVRMTGDIGGNAEMRCACAESTGRNPGGYA